MTNAELCRQHIVLESDLVLIEPLAEAHYDALCTIALDKDIWQYTSSRIGSAADFKHYFEMAMQERNAGQSYPFALTDKRSGKVVGCTRYGSIQMQHKRLEIGWTWIDRSVRGSGFNRACKFLLLSYGFEALELNRIELKTSSLNLVSQKAIEKIGGQREGLFRSHMINPDGTVRDTVYYGLVRSEWDTTRKRYFHEFIQ